MGRKIVLKNFVRTNDEGFMQGFAPTDDPAVDVSVVDAFEYEPCDVAVVWGCETTRRGERGHFINHVHRSHKGTRIILETGFFGRKQVVRPQPGFLKRVVARRKPSGPLMRAVVPYARVGIDGAFAHDGRFLNENSPPDRWRALQDELGLEIKPYRTEGEHVLITLQVPGDASLAGLEVADWLVETVERLLTLTDRPIRIRSHPNMSVSYSQDMQARIRSPQVAFLPVENRDISVDLENCWACVTYSSSSSVDALLHGVPAICLSPANMAYGVSSKTLEDVASPALPKREQFMYDLAYAQWSREEIAAGKVWPRFRAALLDMFP